MHHAVIRLQGSHGCKLTAAFKHPRDQVLCRPTKSVTALVKAMGGTSGGTLGSLLLLLEAPADEVRTADAPKLPDPSRPEVGTSFPWAQPPQG